MGRLDLPAVRRTVDGDAHVTGSGAPRIAHLDGLRGIAVLLVVVGHAWQYFYLPNSAFPLHRDWHLPLGGAFNSSGQEGVSLFLVLSGFCLSYPLWQRRKRGEAAWFQPSTFFARRCLRILPPYYAALGIFLTVSIVGGPHLRALIPALEGDVTGANVLSHLLLLHNLTPYSSSIDAPFWSLGLEWQWYWVFPLVVYGCVGGSRRVLGLTALLAVAWLGVSYGFGGQWWTLSVWVSLQPLLPQRLFEFACGVAVARALVSGVHFRRWELLAGVAGLLAIRPLASLLYLNHVVDGLLFAAVLVVAWQWPGLQSALSWRPLVWVGVISYSVYLVHDPIMEGSEYMLAPFLPVPVVIALGVAVALVSGFLFHLAIERPAMGRRTWVAVSPALIRRLRWTDAVYAGRTVSVPDTVAEPVVATVP